MDIDLDVQAIPCIGNLASIRVYRARSTAVYRLDRKQFLLLAYISLGNSAGHGA